MPTGKHAAGFSYLFVLMLVGLAGLGLALTGGLWSAAAQRERETELLFIGNQYRQAIARYYQRFPEAPSLPRTLDDLLEDRRSGIVARHLRRAWPDPMRAGWVLLTTPDGQFITGIASRAEVAPLKRHGFPPENRHFETATQYRDWAFVFDPSSL